MIIQQQQLLLPKLKPDIIMSSLISIMKSGFPTKPSFHGTYYADDLFWLLKSFCGKCKKKNFFKANNFLNLVYNYDCSKKSTIDNAYNRFRLKGGNHLKGLLA